MDLISTFLSVSFLVFTLDFTYGSFILKTTELQWTDAKTSCEGMSMVLYKQSEVGQWSNLANGVTLPNNSSFWIGLSWSSATSDWRWTDNSAITTGQDYWETGEPNTAAGYECVLQNTVDGKWATAMCSEMHDYVCQAGPPTTVIYNTPYPRPQAKRDNNAVMLEGLLKGFACAGGLILLVTLVMHLPCCRNWVKRKEAEVNSWQEHLQKNKMQPDNGAPETQIETVGHY